MNNRRSNVESVADWLLESHCVAAFTGAGISTESGIPDFRSPTGVWAKYRPVYFNEFLDSPQSRIEYWRQKAEAHSGFQSAAPNAAHRILAGWEAAGTLAGVITQNIDGLHQLAGSKSVFELHGSARFVGCLSCDFRGDADPWVRLFLEQRRAPNCPECGGLLKHATVSFGQSLPEDVLKRAVDLAERADLFLALGPSLVVFPAAGLPEIAQRNGARLVIINRDETPLDPLADVVIHAGLGDALRGIDTAVRVRTSERATSG